MFTLGEVTVMDIVETTMAFPMTQAFVGLDGEGKSLDALREELPPSLFDEEGTPLMVFRSHVLRTPHNLIVVDTCWGNHKERRLDPYAHMLDTGYLSALSDAGIDPADVDYVFNTHLHQDHVGWNTSWTGKAWQPTFPNATYLLVRSEYEHWTTVPSGHYGHDSFADSITPIVKADRHRFVDPGQAIDDTVRIVPLPGHTPGHCGIHVTSDGQQAVFSGDLFHTAYQFMRPHWRIVSEHAPDEALATRTDFLERYAGTDVRILPAHFNVPEGGHITRHGEHYGFALA
jgi:glyoxylase-like metal-dependent hydrolase (beta-lactamase superfamily II)